MRASSAIKFLENRTFRQEDAFNIRDNRNLAAGLTNPNNANFASCAQAVQFNLTPTFLKVV